MRITRQHTSQFCGTDQSDSIHFGALGASELLYLFRIYLFDFYLVRQSELAGKPYKFPEAFLESERACEPQL